MFRPYVAIADAMREGSAKWQCQGKKHTVQNACDWKGKGLDYSVVLHLGKRRKKKKEEGHDANINTREEKRTTNDKWVGVMSTPPHHTTPTATPPPYRARVWISRLHTLCATVPICTTSKNIIKNNGHFVHFVHFQFFFSLKCFIFFGKIMRRKGVKITLKAIGCVCTSREKIIGGGMIRQNGMCAIRSRMDGGDMLQHAHDHRAPDSWAKRHVAAPALRPARSRHVSPPFNATSTTSPTVLYFLSAARFKRFSFLLLLHSHPLFFFVSSQQCWNVSSFSPSFPAASLVVSRFIFSSWRHTFWSLDFLLFIFRRPFLF